MGGNSLEQEDLECKGPPCLTGAKMKRNVARLRVRSPAGTEASCVLNKTHQRGMVPGRTQQRAGGEYLTLELIPECLALGEET